AKDQRYSGRYRRHQRRTVSQGIDVKILEDRFGVALLDPETELAVGRDGHVAQIDPLPTLYLPDCLLRLLRVACRPRHFERLPVDQDAIVGLRAGGETAAAEGHIDSLLVDLTGPGRLERQQLHLPALRGNHRKQLADGIRTTANLQLDAV